MKVLVIEDDPTVGAFIKRGLEEQRWGVQLVTDGEEGEQVAATESFDVIVLDMRLPGKSGLEVLQSLRARGFEKPVLVLTAQDAVDAKVRTLRAGADDYVTKPFAFEELLARIRVHLRRREERADLLRAAHVILDLRARKAERGGTPVVLTPREFALLEYFLRHPGQVLTRAQILAEVWGYDADPSSNVVDVYVRYLRERLDRPGAPPFIETVRGVGYRVAAS